MSETSPTILDTDPPPPTDVSGGAWPAELGGFLVGAVIGEGGMGVVHRAYDPMLRRWIALKTLRPEVSASPWRSSIIAEAVKAAALEHPNIVPVYGAGEDKGIAFIAMRLVDGPSLESLLSGDEPLDLAEALSILWQLGNALDALHGQGLCHRDVTPSNVLLCPGPFGWHAYLSDFGLAGFRGVHSMSRNGGTAGYRPPECLRGATAGPAADVFAMGRTALRMLAHRRDVPRRVLGCMDRALAERPKQRYATAGAFSRSLVDALGPPACGPEPVRGSRRGRGRSQPSRRSSAASWPRS